MTSLAERSYGRDSNPSKQAFILYNHGLSKAQVGHLIMSWESAVVYQRSWLFVAPFRLVGGSRSKLVSGQDRSALRLAALPE